MTTQVDSLLADTKLLRRRLKDNPLTSVEAVNKALIDDVIPLISATLEQVADQDSVIQEFADQIDDYLQPETAAQFLETFGLGSALIKEARALVSEADDLLKKRIESLCAAFEKSLEISAMVVADAALEDSDDESGDDEEEESDDDEGGDSDFDEDKTPPEIPSKKVKE